MLDKMSFFHTFKSELIWYLISLVLCLVILFPIYYFEVDYGFWWVNAIFIFGLSVFTRWIFLWKYTPFARWMYYKVVLAFLMIPLFFWTMYAYAGFKDFVNEIGIQEILKEVPVQDQMALAKYIQNQITFFSVGFMICILIIPFKMIYSIWMQFNRGTV